MYGLTSLYRRRVSHYFGALYKARMNFSSSCQVFTCDIENALGFIFNNTVIYTANSSGRWPINFNESNARSYLKKFLHVTLKYLKAPDHIQYHTYNFIETVYNEIKNNNVFTAEDLQQTLINIQRNGEAEKAYLSKWQPSVSCHNINTAACYNDAWLASCGTWNMFHTMTVSADNETESLEVIEAIKGFMTYFFSCGDCRFHFAGMYNQTIGTYGYASVDTLDKAILWLWCAHNAVNQDWTLTEGRYWPPHPVFPLRSACECCWGKNPSHDSTTCAILFCNGTTGSMNCFEAPSDEEHPDVTHHIDYGYFSESLILNYLKRVYSGVYPKLNTNQEWKEIIFNENPPCPNSTNSDLIK
ncbi:unnamed protein product, partial [Meganyctiphanes norvegica]